MNAARRKRLRGLDLGYVLNELAEIGADERDAYDALPDSIRDSERGEKMSEIVDAIDEVIEALNTLDNAEPCT